jgi:hypothetical protein
MSIETIASLKAKRIANKRKTIKGDTEDMGLGLGSSLGLAGSSSSELRGMLDYDFDVTKDILNRERQWRNRTSVLQSSGKVCDIFIRFLSKQLMFFFSLKIMSGIFEKHICYPTRS